MNTQTRLTRSADDKVLGGVCGGLGSYFGVDPVIVRLIFVGLIFAGGLSVVLYPVLWLIMPATTTRRTVLADGLEEMQQVAGQVRATAGEGAQALRAKVGAAFTTGNMQPRFDPQTGQPLPEVAHNRNGVLGIALVGIGVLMLASMFPGGSSAALALMLLAGGAYLLRRTS